MKQGMKMNRPTLQEVPSSFTVLLTGQVEHLVTSPSQLAQFVPVHAKHKENADTSSVIWKNSSLAVLHMHTCHHSQKVEFWV